MESISYGSYPEMMVQSTENEVDETSARVDDKVEPSANVEFGVANCVRHAYCRPLGELQCRTSRNLSLCSLSNYGSIGGRGGGSQIHSA